MPKRANRNDPKTAALLQEGTLNPSPERRSRPEVPGERVLRPARSGASEVRDAAPRIGRQRRRSPTRPASTGSLARPTTRPGRASMRPGSQGSFRRRGARAGRTSSKGRSWRSSRSSSSLASRSAHASWRSRSGRSSRWTSIRGRSSARLAEKKRRRERRRRRRGSSGGASVTERYETLRTAVLGEGLPFEARNGLALFLRRGMWAWARAAATPSPPPQPPRSPCTKTTDHDEQRAVVHLFAAMATRSTNRGAHERIPQSPVPSSRA